MVRAYAIAQTAFTQGAKISASGAMDGLRFSRKRAVLGIVTLNCPLSPTPGKTMEKEIKTVQSSRVKDKGNKFVSMFATDDGVLRTNDIVAVQTGAGENLAPPSPQSS